MITEREFNQWVAELENGDLPQITGRLKVVGDGNRFGYCCLGVYCEKVKEYKFDPTLMRFEYERYGEMVASSGLAPNWDMDEKVQRALTLLNDGGVDEDGGEIRPHSFPEIAKFLRHKGYAWASGGYGADTDPFRSLPEGFEL